MGVIEKVSVETHEGGDAICVAYYNNQVFSGGVDGKIKIWDNDLNLIKSVDAHEAYVYAIAVNSNGKVYSSSCDGTVKFILPPYDKVEDLFRCEDAIQAMYMRNDNVLFTGDDKGVVTNWQNDKMLFKYNLVEEVKSLAVESSLIYTVRDLDVVVSEMLAGKTGRYSTKAVFPGKSPLALVGPNVDGKRNYLAFADRTGKGLICVTNLPHASFSNIWTLPDCHEMIVNGICGDEKYLYSGGYDKKVRAWTDLEQKVPKAMGEIDVGCIVNQICCGTNHSIYIAASDGNIYKAKFI